MLENGLLSTIQVTVSVAAAVGVGGVIEIVGLSVKKKDYYTCIVDRLSIS